MRKTSSQSILNSKEAESKIRTFCKQISDVASGKQETDESINAVKQLTHTVLDTDKSQNYSVLLYDILMTIYFSFIIIIFHCFYITLAF